MSINLKCIFLLAFFLIFSNMGAHPIFERGGEFNPEKLLAESRAFNEKADQALMRATLYQQEGSIFLDSALYFNNMLRTNSNTNNYNLYIKQLETNFSLANKYIAMADSMALLSENFSELSSSKSKEAYALMGANNIQSNLLIQPVVNSKSTSVKVVSSGMNPSKETSVKQVVNNNKNETTTQNYIAFIIQLGAGDLNLNYFSKVPDIKVVNCKDGIKRYVLAGQFSKTEASKKKDELISLGYDQVFIRTKESMDKISN